MAIKNIKPVGNGRRGTSYVDFSDLTKSKKNKSLFAVLNKKSGRNNSGKITLAHRGGGSKRFYRIVNFGMFKEPKATVIGIEYDPNRSANIALIKYESGLLDYILAPDKIKVGNSVQEGKSVAIRPGNRMKLVNIPIGTAIHNVEFLPEQGGKLCRSAGNSATLLSIDGAVAQLKLPSSEIRRVPSECFASIGSIGNSDLMNISIGKAGRKRHIGIKPTVRGKAKNAVDHPHGGGEGGTSIGMTYPKTPWGMPTLGYRTRDKKKHNSSIIKRRSK